MSKISALFKYLIVVLLGGALLVGLSLRGERSHLENCAHLDVACEEGNVHRAVRFVEQFIEKRVMSLTREAPAAPSGADQPQPDGN